MDPNAKFAEIREKLGMGSRNLSDMDAIVAGVAELDEWLSKGGFLPDAWRVRMSPKAMSELAPAEQDDRRRRVTDRHLEAKDYEYEGWPCRFIPAWKTDAERYPRSDVFQFGAWPVMVIETGGYSDLSLIDPYTGHEFWAGEVFRDEPDGSTVTMFEGIRRALAAAEANGFGVDPEEEADEEERRQVDAEILATVRAGEEEQRRINIEIDAETD